MSTTPTPVDIGDDALRGPPGEPGERPVGILVIHEFGKAVREFRITLDEVSIGRDGGGEVVLDDLGVSRAHARVLRRGGRFLIEDLGSRNGTLVNRRKLPSGGRYALRNEDRIQVGRSILRFLIHVSRRVASSLGMGRASATLTDAPPEERRAAPARPSCLFRLHHFRASLLIAPEGGCAERHLLESDSAIIGSGREADIVLHHPTVAGTHAEIIYNREGFHLVDRNSPEGTFLGGVAVQVAPLAPRSFIRFGQVKALFIVQREGKEPEEPGFDLRDFLCERFPAKAEEIQRAFKESRLRALDFAEELILAGTLDPEEWWLAVSDFERPSSRGLWGRVRRLFGRR